MGGVHHTGEQYGEETAGILTGPVHSDPLAGSAHQQQKAGQAACGAGQLPQRCAAHQQAGEHTEHQAGQQHRTAGVFVAPSGGNACKKHAHGSALAPGEVPVQLQPVGQKEDQAQHQRPQVNAGAAHPQVDRAECRVKVEEQPQHHQQEGGMNRLLAGSQLGAQPDGEGERGGIGQIEDPFAQPQKDLVQADGNGPSAPLHIVVILRDNDVPEGFHRFVGGKFQQIGVIVGNQGSEPVEHQHHQKNSRKNQSHRMQKCPGRK